MQINRRHFMARAGAGMAALTGLLAGCSPRVTATATPRAAQGDGGAGAARIPLSGLTYPYRLPDLPYAPDALEPHVDARTMEIHHQRHHQSYVDNLNGALENRPELQRLDLVELLRDLSQVPEGIRTRVRNNGGGHLNHAQFWRMMRPAQQGAAPTGDLSQRITRDFGSMDEFRGRFRQAALDVFGSGWAWLVTDPAGALRIVQTPNQDTPVMQGAHPVLGIDVWEHAYYLRYQNRRAEYIDNWWNVVDWAHVGERYRGRTAERS